MSRILDIGLEKLRSMIVEMAQLSEKTVSSAIEAYTEGKDVRDTIFKDTEHLKRLQKEIGQLSVELLARYGPVASDLRQIKSDMEISYDFLRFGRYAYDISQVMRVFGDLTSCGIHSKAVVDAAKQVREMMRLSIKAFIEKDRDVAKKLREMDDVVDKIDLDHLQNIAKTPESDPRCSVSAALILRYLERIADHATYVGDSVKYIVSG